jgi:hypothetical protein
VGVFQVRCKRAGKLALIAAVAAMASGCGGDVLNQIVSLGSEEAGSRGIVSIVFINNTDHQAVFTAGTYDRLDQTHQPAVLQFDREGEMVLGARTHSSIVGMPCARAFGIGTPQLLDLLRRNGSATEINDDLLIDGVAFFQVSDGSAEGTEDAGDSGTSEPADEDASGKAPPLEALLGVDFPCNSLLILRFEINDLGPDPFRVDFELIPSSSDR